MNRKNITTFIIGLAIFIGLVGYNYFIAQKKIKETKPSPLGISLVSYPEEIILGQTGTFIWSIDSSPDLFTSKTSIFWSYESTPSALTQNDSPEAVGYPYYPVDYTHGLFRLPDTFDVNITFDRAIKVYFRAYAKVGDNHLWTDEKSIKILPNR